jgi:hypothetical protein
VKHIFYTIGFISIINFSRKLILNMNSQQKIQNSQDSYQKLTRVTKDTLLSFWYVVRVSAIESDKMGFKEFSYGSHHC